MVVSLQDVTKEDICGLLPKEKQGIIQVTHKHYRKGLLLCQHKAVLYLSTGLKRHFDLHTEIRYI